MGNLNVLNQVKMESAAFDIVMDDDCGSGGSCVREILKNGPITVNARCDDREEDGGKQDEQVAIEIIVKAPSNKNLFVFGHLDDDPNMDNSPIDDFKLEDGHVYKNDMWVSVDKFAGIQFAACVERS